MAFSKSISFSFGTTYHGSVTLTFLSTDTASISGAQSIAHPASISYTLTMALSKPISGPFAAAYLGTIAYAFVSTDPTPIS